MKEIPSGLHCRMIAKWESDWSDDPQHQQCSIFTICILFLLVTDIIAYSKTD